MSALALVEDVIDAEVVELEPMTEAEARALTTRLRAALSIANELMVEAYRREAWRALGYVSWRAYCRAELHELRGTKIPRAQRRALVAELSLFMKQRELAEAYGLDEKTVRNDLEHLRLVRDDERAIAPAPAPPLALPAAPGRGTDRVVALVTAAGEAGMTTLEVMAALGWHHGQAGGALSALHAQGRLERLTEKRDRHSVYVVAAYVSGRQTVSSRQIAHRASGRTAC